MSKITIDKAVLEQALDALDNNIGEYRADGAKAILSKALLMVEALAQPQPVQPLTEREIILLDGMIHVQLRHAEQCDSMGNRTMAEKQKSWDMERVELLRKLKDERRITKGTP